MSVNNYETANSRTLHKTLNNQIYYQDFKYLAVDCEGSLAKLMDKVKITVHIGNIYVCTSWSITSNADGNQEFNCKSHFRNNIAMLKSSMARLTGKRFKTFLVTSDSIIDRHCNGSFIGRNVSEDVYGKIDIITGIKLKSERKMDDAISKSFSKESQFLLKTCDDQKLQMEYLKTISLISSSNTNNGTVVAGMEFRVMVKIPAAVYSNHRYLSRLNRKINGRKSYNSDSLVIAKGTLSIIFSDDLPQNIASRNAEDDSIASFPNFF